MFPLKNLWIWCARAAAAVQEGCDAGRFKIVNVRLMAEIIHYCVKGLEVPYIYDRLGEGLTEEETIPIVADIIGRAIGIEGNI